MATQFAAVEDLLGVQAGNDTRLNLAYSIERGLPVSALDRVAKAVAPQDVGFKFRLVRKATLERRRKSQSKSLTMEEGDRLARLAKVYSFAREIYGDEIKARDFLQRPHPMLDEKSPVDVALATGPGAEVVINLLGRTAFGGGA